MQNPILKTFGKSFIKEVRDLSIDIVLMELTRKSKGKIAKPLNDIITGNPDCVRAVEMFLPYIVDTTLHYMMAYFEASDQAKMIWEEKNGSPTDLAEASDGLAGELYTEDGWIAKLSKHPPTLIGQA